MSRNEITGDLITSRATNQAEYEKGWEAIFGPKKQKVLDEPEIVEEGSNEPQKDV